MNRPKRFAVLSILILFISACSDSQQRIARDSTIGGVLAGGVGAVSGALIGHAIANGDVAASAMLGTAIGAPIGILLGAYYAGADEELVMWQNDRIIEENERYLARNRYQLEARRQDLIEEMGSIRLDPARRTYRFYGQTLGNPYR